MTSATNEHSVERPARPGFARWQLAVALLLLSNCATLSHYGMTPRCAERYDACVNRCPQGNSGGLVSFNATACLERCQTEANACR